MATSKAPAKKSAAKKSTTRKAATRKAAKKSTTPPSKRWSAKVTTDSTKPGPGLFKKSAKAIAEGLAKKSVSPKGPGQGMQMLSFYENRGGKNLSPERKKTLDKAKVLLHEKVQLAKKSPAKKTAKKAAKKSA
jgi:tRNA(adenine34) deaminase